MPMNWLELNEGKGLRGFGSRIFRSNIRILIFLPSLEWLGENFCKGSIGGVTGEGKSRHSR